MTRFHFPILLGLLLGVTFLANCQELPSAKKPKPGASLEEVASIFVNSMAEYDFETFSTYVLPKEIEDAGGLEKLQELLEKGAEYYKGQGIKLSGKADKPSAISKCNGEWQCVLRQLITWEWKDRETGEMKRPVVESNLVAISTDNGVTWKFVIGGKDLAILRTKYPNLCEDLVFQLYPSQQSKE
jgi:hypothetical protein